RDDAVTITAVPAQDGVGQSVPEAAVVGRPEVAAEEASAGSAAEAEVLAEVAPVQAGNRCARKNFSASSSTIGSCKQFAKPNRKRPDKFVFTFSAGSSMSIRWFRLRKNFTGLGCTERRNEMRS